MKESKPEREVLHENRSEIVPLEKKILKHFIAGSHSAFKTIIERYQRMVYHLAYRMTMSHDAANDLAQDTFISLWENRLNYDPRFPPFPWLRRVVINKTLNYLARHEIKYKSDREEELQYIESPRYESPEATLGLKEEYELAHAVLTEMSDDKRVTLALRIEGLSYAEIADHMGCSIGTIMSRLSRIREEVRSRIGEMSTTQQ